MCIPDVVKNISLKVFNIIPRTNETRYIKLHETSKCKCRLDASLCNNKHRLDEDKCRCDFKELIDKGSCDKRFIWNPSNCEYIILYIALFSVLLTINIGIGTFFVYYKHINHDIKTVVKEGSIFQTTIY